MVDFRRPDPLDEFPLGDGTAASETIVVCPYCGEANEIALDAGGGPTQVYVEDCQVSCRAWQVRVRYLPHGGADATVEALSGFATPSHFTTLHHSAMYSARRFWYG